MKLKTKYDICFRTAIDIRDRKFPANMTHVLTLHSYGMRQYICVHEDDITFLMNFFSFIGCIMKVNITPIDEFIRFH